MKTIITAALLAASLTQPAMAAETPEIHGQVAPADRYFGKTKISILGIRNMISDLGVMVVSKPEMVKDVLHKAEFAEQAMHEWAEQFPEDPWLSGYAHNLVTLYEKCSSEEGGKRRRAAQDWFNEHFPESQFAEPF